jgi:hypothetical protein
MFRLPPAERESFDPLADSILIVSARRRVYSPGATRLAPSERDH